MRRESATAASAASTSTANAETASEIASTVESSAEPSSIIAISTESVSVSEPIVETELSMEVVESTDSAIHSFPSEAFDAGESSISICIHAARFEYMHI